MGNKSLKVSYMGEERKFNFYLKPKELFEDLHGQITSALSDYQVPTSRKYRYYWIDSEGDEIEIKTHDDYLIYFELCGEKPHLIVSPIPMTKKTTFKHLKVSCDNCGKRPIVGFRYKCLQCPNYDLCEKCEMQHAHNEHLMLRMPNGTFRQMLRHFKPTRNGVCPVSNIFDPYLWSSLFENKTSSSSSTENVNVNANSSNVDNGTSTKKSDNEENKQKHTKREVKSGGSGGGSLLANLYEMMNDLAEGGARNTATVNATAEQAAKVATSTNTAAMQLSQTANGLTAALLNMPSCDASSTSQAANLAMDVAKIAEQAATSITSNIFGQNSNNKTRDATYYVLQPGTGVEIITENNNNNGDNKNDDNSSKISTAPTTLNNISQIIDPQCMKQGLEILTNFSDLFSKMLDSMEGVNDKDSSISTTNSRRSSTDVPKPTTETPNQSINIGEINDKDSNISTTNSGRTSTDVPTTSVSKPTAETSNQSINIGEINDKDSNISTTNSGRSSTDVPTTSVPKPTAETSNQSINIGKDGMQQQSSSLEGDWLMLDESVTSSDTNHTAPDLLDMSVSSNTTGVNSGELTANTLVEVEAQENLNHSSVNDVQTTENKSSENINDVVHHTDENINNAIIAMINMGFSNEGQWLTNLLESTLGNIDEALNLISTAQANKQHRP